MIRWIGAVCVIAATAYAGIEHSKTIQRRIIQLNILKQIIVQLYGDVEYGGCTLAESFQRIAVKQKEPFYSWLICLYETIENEKKGVFGEIFHSITEETLKTSALKPEDKESLLQFGNQLGNAQRNNQMRVLQLYIRDLEQVIGELEKEKKEKQRLSQVLGISSGVLIVILLL